MAVTGDGVNDVPALQAADVGVAMGERGTRSAREVAAIVLLNDNFRTIVRAIAEARQLFHNLRASFGYLLLVHLPLVFTAAFVPLAGYPLLYLPIQKRVFLEEVVLEDGTLYRVPPLHVDSNTSVPLDDTQRISALFSLPGDPTPSAVRSYRVAWAVQSGSSTYVQRTPFVQVVVRERHYPYAVYYYGHWPYPWGPPYYDWPYYDWPYYDWPYYGPRPYWQYWREPYTPLRPGYARPWPRRPERR